MPAYRVLVPCTLTLTTIVVADSQSEALSAAFNYNWTADVRSTATLALVEDFQLHTDVSRRGGGYAGYRKFAEARPIAATLDPSWYTPNEPDTLAPDYHDGPES